MAHPRAKLTVAGRRLLVERIRGQGWPVPRAAEAQGVSVATADNWLRRRQLEGTLAWPTAARVPTPVRGDWGPTASRPS